MIAGSAFDSAEPSAGGKLLLAAALDLHKDDYIHRMDVAGYTDRIGDDACNLKLSRKRADTVQWLSCT